MKKVIRVAQRAVCAFGIFGSLLLSTSCTDEVNNGIIPEDSSSGVSIFIPNISGAASFANSRSDFNSSTRAEVEVTETESTINNIYLVAFQGEEIFKVVKINKTGSSVEGDYTEYGKVNLPKGNYRFYLLANLDSYLPEGKSSVDKITVKSEIENLILNFGNDQGLSLTGDNLPMFCLPKDIKTSIDDSSKMGSDGTLEITEDGNGGKIYADLTFLCSKVRYTILFNNTPDGISYKFGENYIDFATNEEAPHFATNIRQSTALELSSEATSSSFIQKGGNLYNHSLSLGKYKYPERGDEYGSVEDENSTPDNDLTENFSENDNSQIAWQGYFYIPENITTDPTEQTTLTFSGVVKSPDGSTIDSETFANRSVYVQGSGEKEGKGNVRGMYYDIVSKVTSGINNDLATTVSVSNWTLHTLEYSIHGPYELTVNKTSVSLTSGEVAEINYHSDVEVTGISPMIYWTETGGEVNFQWPEGTEESTAERKEFLFTIDTQTQAGKVLISTNDRIPYHILHSLKEQNHLSKVNYIHLKAGNLLKKIMITPLDVKQYLNVDPVDILIDVREYITSGIDSNFIEIKIECNITDEISYSGTLAEFIHSTNVLNITPGDETIITEEKINLNQGNGSLKLNMEGFFAGNPFWGNSKNYSLTLKASDDENLTKTINVTIKPYTTDYVIHFRYTGNDDIWNNPHIYVYQCLELPMDLKPEDENYKYRGKTVGYNTDGAVSALEYIFTNDVSFRGWLGYGGPWYEDPEDYRANNPNKSNSTFSDGFVYLGWNGGSTKDYANSFKPTDYNTDRYNFETDLNYLHYSKHSCWVCEDCREEKKYRTYNDHGRTWPGIAMEPEGDGWWKYTLTGIATPGKAMIMFTDDHTTVSTNNVDDNRRRYPANNAVGIPLFDYPDNEGWFIYDGNINAKHSFKDDKPTLEKKEFEIGDEINVQWKSNIHADGGSPVNKITIWTSKGSIDPVAYWPGTEGKREGDYYTYNFKITSAPVKEILYTFADPNNKKIVYHEYGGNEGEDYKFTVANTKVENGKYVLTIEGYDDLIHSK